MNMIQLRRKQSRLTSRLRRFFSFTVSAALVSATALPPTSHLAYADDDRKIYFFHPDHLGSTSLVTDEQGQVVYRAEYAPYGATVQQTGTFQPAHQFTGQRFDPSTGLYYYNARYYDPELGRFIQPDPLVQATADPQALNRYSYVRNNPVKYVDPSGHFWFIPFIIAAIKAVAAFAIAHPVVFGAIVNGVLNVATNASQIKSVGDFAKFAAVGAASGAIGAWTGVSVFGALSGTLGAFGGGLVSAASGGLTGGFVGGTGNALAGGANARQAFTIGAQMAVASAVMSTALFVAGYGIVRTVQAVQGARATQSAGGTRTSGSRQSTQSRIVVGQPQEVGGPPPGGTRVYRVWGRDQFGEGAGPWGRHWTTVDPRTVPDYRRAAGLPPENTGRFLSEGVLKDPTGVTTQPATYGPTTKPGTTMVPDVSVPNPAQQIEMENVSGLNPDF